MHYRDLRAYLKQQEFGKFLKITSKQDVCVTGRFEVSVIPSGNVLYERDRRKRGGFLRSEDDRRALSEKIDSILLGQDPE